jgi:hypothetical protein
VRHFGRIRDLEREDWKDKYEGIGDFNSGANLRTTRLFVSALIPTQTGLRLAEIVVAE